VPQALCLLDDRSAQLTVVLPLEIDGVPRSVSVARAATILDRLGLASQASLPIDCLSASARQRVAVARALVREPELVIADHPTSMQDAEGAELVCGAIAHAAKQGAACLVLGRDPALRIIAEREGWRQLVLVDCALTPMSEVKLDGTTMEELIVGIETAPVRTPVEIPVETTPDNIVPFPVAAGAGG
jgi:ABC-type ATPase involved in cell division